MRIYELDGWISITYKCLLSIDCLRSLIRVVERAGDQGADALDIEDIVQEILVEEYLEDLIGERVWACNDIDDVREIVSQLFSRSRSQCTRSQCTMYDEM